MLPITQSDPPTPNPVWCAWPRYAEDLDGLPTNQEDYPKAEVHIPDWLKRNFNLEYLKAVQKLSGGTYWRIPTGKVREARAPQAPQAPQAAYCEELRIAYSQKKLPLCTGYALLSALSLYGDNEGTGFLLTLMDTLERQVAGGTLLGSLGGRGFTPNTTTGKYSACPRMALLRQWFLQNMPALRFWDAKWIGQQRSLTDVCAHLRSHLVEAQILLVQLLGSDGSASHAVCIVKRDAEHYILDSNEKFAMYLSPRSLATCCGCAHVSGWQAILQLRAQPKLVQSKARLLRAEIDS